MVRQRGQQSRELGRCARKRLLVSPRPEEGAPPIRIAEKVHLQTGEQHVDYRRPREVDGDRKRVLERLGRVPVATRDVDDGSGAELDVLAARRSLREAAGNLPSELFLHDATRIVSEARQLDVMVRSD